MTPAAGTSVFRYGPLLVYKHRLALIRSTVDWMYRVWQKTIPINILGIFLAIA